MTRKSATSPRPLPRAHLAWAIGSVLASAALTLPTAAAQQADNTAAVADAATELDAIVVTGSRIRREPGFEGPAPVNVVSAEEIASSGHTQIADLVNQLPGFAVSQSNQTSNQNGNQGINALDLRGMGVQRTLTLVDGRRQVPSIPGTSGVDVSMLPAGMIERVEVVTGGASALYGADAVNGVVNFILKQNYSGLEASVRHMDSTRGDMPTVTGDVLFGQNFADNRGNVTLYGFVEEASGRVSGQDRPWTADGYPMNIRAAAGQPYEIYDGARNLYNSPDANVVLGNCAGRNPADCLYTFTADGQLRRPDLGPDGLYLSSGSNLLQQGVTQGGEYGGRYDSWLLSVPQSRQTLRSTVNFDFNEHARGFASINYAQSQSEAAWRGLNAYGSGGAESVPYYSPFITAEMIAANGGPFTQNIAFGRHFDQELGMTSSHYKRKLLQAHVGLEGDFQIAGRDWYYNASYGHGRSTEKGRVSNGVSANRFYDGLNARADAQGNAVCVSGNAGCVPINPFQRLTGQMVDWLTYDTDWSRTELTQKVASAYASGGLFDLPAGEVKLVVGSEYRKESNDIGVIAQYNPDSPLYDPSLGSTATPLSGAYSVKELYAEASIPLLAGLTGAQRLNLDLAGRLSDYSTAGRTSTSKLGLEWSPIDDVTLRGTYGRAVRAPNIAELFTAGSVSGAWVYDPCNEWALGSRTDRTEYTAANCAAIAPTDTSVANYWQWKDIIQAGNVNLKPETAKTTTVGLVLRPRFVPNLSLAVDYYRIDLQGVIAGLGFQTILNRCVDQASLDNPFCGLVERDANGDLVAVNVQQLNLSQSLARGVDINANWYTQLPGNAGRLSLDLSYSKNLERKDVADPANPDDAWDYVGTFGSPEWKGSLRTGWQREGLSLSWTLRHYSKMRASEYATSALYRKPWAGSTFYHDVYASYQLSDQVSVFGGLNNAFDRAPPRVPGAEAGGAGFNQSGYQAGLYDVVGRTWNVGVRVSL